MGDIADLPGRVIERLGLEPHPEGGHYRETWRAAGHGRPAGTAIYFLLAAGERSHWHRIDSAEIWHHYSGAPLLLSTWNEDEATITDRTLGPDVLEGELPQIVVPAGQWQAARSLGAWTLAGCTVSPGFQFETFELAEEGWAPEVID